MTPRAVAVLFLAVGVGFTAVLANLYSDAGVLYKKRARPGAATSTTPLPNLGSAPLFRFTQPDGTEFSSEQLKGRVWILNFFFTSCDGPCPVTMKQLQELSTKLPGDRVHFVSLSVDPESDTPEALRAYGEKHGLDPSRWHLLRGPIAEVRRIGEEDLKLAFGEGISSHTNRVVLIDPQGSVRGSYLGLKPNEIERLLADTNRLLSENAPQR